MLIFDSLNVLFYRGPYGYWGSLMQLVQAHFIHWKFTKINKPKYVIPLPFTVIDVFNSYLNDMEILRGCVFSVSLRSNLVDQLSHITTHSTWNYFSNEYNKYDKQILTSYIKWGFGVILFLFCHTLILQLI